jgi:hypothetical protein
LHRHENEKSRIVARLMNDGAGDPLAESGTDSNHYRDCAKCKIEAASAARQVITGTETTPKIPAPMPLST